MRVCCAHLVRIHVSHVVHILQLAGTDIAQDHSGCEVQVIIAKDDIKVDLKIARLADPKHTLSFIVRSNCSRPACESFTILDTFSDTRKLTMHSSHPHLTEAHQAFVDRSGCRTAQRGLN